jgi:hypothetical protein
MSDEGKGKRGAQGGRTSPGASGTISRDIEGPGKPIASDGAWSHHGCCPSADSYVLSARINSP